MLDKKQIWVIFLFQFKMGRETVETTCNINNTFGSEAAKECAVQWWFKKFCNRDESLEDEEHSGQPAEVDSNQLRGSSRQILLQLHERLPKNSTLTFLLSFGIWSRLERWRKLDKWLPYELTKSEKNIILASPLLLFCSTTMNHFSMGLWYATKSGFDTITGNDQPLWDWEKAPKHFAKPILHQEKVGGQWSASGLIHYSFLNSGETIPSEKYAQQINEMHCKLQSLQPALVNRKGPILLHDNALPHVTQPTLWKLKESGYEVLPHPPNSPDLSPTDYHFLKHLDTFL